MDEKTLRLDQKAFSCAICLSLPQDPVTIECGHSYCRGCVTLHWDREQQHGAAACSCPMCQQKFPQRPALVKSTMLAFLLDELQKPPPPTDEKSLTEKFVEQQDLINQIQCKESDLFLLRQMEDKISESADNALEGLKQFTTVSELLQANRTDLEKHISARLDRHVAHMHQLQIPLQVELAELRSTLSRLDRQAVVPDHQPTLSGNWLLFDEVKTALSGLQEKLMATIKDGSASVIGVINRVGTVLPSVSAEPRTRVELLTYARNPLSLDLSSAHPVLLLSADRKQVSFTGVNQRYPEHPSRFTEHWQVLSMSSRTGQWYFEVEWQITGHLRLAVIDTNVDRKDPIKSLFGNTDSCWALHCGKSRFSLWSAGKELPLVGHMVNKVGVYVNTACGALCFYAVSPSTGAILLHRVQTRFKGPVYVGLGFYFCSAEDKASICPAP